jgi:hypothetical protein
MSTNGQLVFTDVDKITFKGVGNTSNAVVDTVTGKIGVGTDNPDANLHVLGNSYVSTNLELGGTLIMGTVNVSAHHSLEAVTAEGNTTPLTVEFQNADTSLVASGNVVVNGNVLFTSNVTTSVDSNVVVEHKGPHGRGTSLLKKYPEIAFAEGKFDANESTNTYVQAGYTVTASSQFSGYHSWEAFDEITGNGTQYWSGSTVKYATTGDYGFLPGNAVAPYLTTVSDTVYNGEWIQLELPHKLKLSYVTFFPRLTNRFPRQGVIAGSNDGTNWDAIHIFSGLTTTIETDVRITTDSENNTTAYKYIRLVITHLNGNEYAGADNIKLYGYEEDPPAGDSSLDTTFTSVMNTPQTTGANVYVDAKLSTDFTNQVTGPTPTGTAATHNDTGKYWELTGALTSNVTVEANTFLEGDAPHSVSVWFNSSNLEANTANTCVFSISDQEHLNSENLDLQSNTWHNLTYAYQGEGGSRVTYLDGRKVAEDQAEDTFGDYPPFAMTGYSQGGYVVSASNPDEGTESPWKYYDNDNSTIKTFGPYYGNSGSYNRSPPTNHGGNVLSGDAVPDGEWHKIKMPHRLKLCSLGIRPRNNSNLGEPVNWSLYGSNDDLNWTMLYKKTDSSVPDDALETQYPVNATSGFSYFLIVMTKSAGYVYLNVSEFNWYGHRENDLVRLPEPTRVLKYPHIAMTGPAQRGYVVSSSGEEYALYPPWKVFNGNSNTGSGSGSESWVSKIDAFTNGISNSNYGFDFGSGQVNGPWLRLDIPHKLKLNYVDVYRRDGGGYDQYPKSGHIYGYDGSTWHLLKTFTNITQPAVLNATTIPIDSNIPVSSIVMLITERYDGTSTTSQFVIIKELEYFGTEEATPVPIQIGGGNIDKVANLRVYDKFVGEDQALEIWDAQKDEFGRAKSSMTLHKGRLGIGTTEPEGRLAVADEPDATTYGLQEFPPRGMTEYETYIEEHGVFRASAGTKDASAGQAYLAFNKTLFERGWHGGPENDGRYTNSLYVGTLSNGGYLGDWIRLDLPYKVKLNSSLLYHRDSTSYVGRLPKKGVILGSNDDGGSWELVHSWDNETYSAFQVKRFDINSNSYFKSFILVVQELVTTATLDPVNLGEWRLFGYREQVTKQSVLHDGQLTLTKNLTVPSIGPSVTDTRHVVPRRHRLVVEFDTSTNPTDLATVKDTSGMGNDGTLIPSAHYSIKEKAFVFDGSGDYIDTGVLSPSLAGAHPHSMSVWFKTNTASGLQFVTCLGEKNGTTGDRRFSAIRVNGSSLQFWQWSNDLSKSGVISADVWYHVVAVYLGGGTSQSTMLMYLNGEQITSWDTDTTDGGVLGLVSPSFAVGEDIARSTYNFNGQISKPLVYDTVLTAAEVKTLYAMGRGDPYHVTNFQNTLVGINLGNGRAPRSALDVRDQIYARTSTVSTFTGQHKCVPEEPMETGLIVSAKKNQYVKLNGSLDTGKSAITIDESLPVVSLSSVAKDKACFGVVSSMEEANSLVRIETVGGVISDAPKTLGDNRAIVNSVGEGAIWVVNTGGPLESGDYITTSNVAGYGQKQEDDVLHNYTVAKITMDCDFTGSNVAVQTIKREETGLRTITEDVWNTLVDYDRSSATETQYSNTLDPEAYSGQSGYTPREVTTIVDYTDGSNTISVEEWSALSPEEQETYQSNTTTEIVDYIKFVTAEEWSSMDPEVQATYTEVEIITYYQIMRGENILDENGQLQWEDKTGATESPYERRFLDASGVQTDEANAVHIAAFVGCTYHCG